MFYFQWVHSIFGIFLFSEEGHGNPSLLSVNPGLIIWTIIIFVILLLVLKKFAWGPLIKALNNREESIKSTLENVEKQNREAQAALEENKKTLAEANLNAKKIIEDGREIAGKMRDEILLKANEDARKMVQQAKTEIEQKERSALESMKNEIVDLAIKSAEKIIKESLDDKKQRKIVNDYMNQIKEN